MDLNKVSFGWRKQSESRTWFRVLLGLQLGTALFLLVFVSPRIGSFTTERQSYFEPIDIGNPIVSERRLKRARAPSEQRRYRKFIAKESVKTPPTNTVLYTVKARDTLTSIWVRHGCDNLGAIRAADAVRKVNAEALILKPGEQVELQVSPSNQVTEFKKRLTDGKTLSVKGDSQNGYSAGILNPTIIESTKTVSGAILSSFSDSALGENVPYTVVDDFVDLFSARVEFHRDIKPGDTFTLSFVERKTADGMILNPGPIVSASLQNNGRFVAAVQHLGDEGEAVYFDEQGNPVGNYFLRYPLKFSRISSSYSTSRFHPVLKVRRPHNGVDFAASIGTPVRSVADGVVVIAGSRGGSGKMVKIAHGSVYSTAYLHLSKISSALRPGSRVKRGQVIGAVGMTGLATGPHLHFSLFERGRYVDPLRAQLPVIPSNITIPQLYLKATLETLREQHKNVIRASFESAKASV